MYSSSSDIFRTQIIFGTVKVHLFEQGVVTGNYEHPIHIPILTRQNYITIKIKFEKVGQRTGSKTSTLTVCCRHSILYYVRSLTRPFPIFFDEVPGAKCSGHDVVLDSGPDAPCQSQEDGRQPDDAHNGQGVPHRVLPLCEYCHSIRIFPQLNFVLIRGLT